MKHSSGIIPYRVATNGELEFFVGHPGGQARPYWSFLKGCVEDGEDTMDAAIREFSEESGHQLSRNTLRNVLPLGTVRQNEEKEVTAYGVEYGDINPDECHSNLVDGTNIPEIDRYAWMTFEELEPLTHPTHIQFYNNIIYHIAYGSEAD